MRQSLASNGGADAEVPAGYGRDFKLYITGQAVSIFGDRIAVIALTFLVIKISHSFAPAVAVFYLCRLLPTLAAGLFVGVFVDQVSRQRLMIAADLGRAALLAGLPAIAALTLWTVYPLVLVLYSLTLVFDTAARAALPDVVPEGRLMGANSIIKGIETAGDLAYALGGTLVYVMSFQAVFDIDAATFLFSALLVSAMWLPPVVRRQAPTYGEVVARIREGIRYLTGNPFLRWSTAALAVAPVAGGAAFVLTPLYADHVLAKSVGLFGPLHSAAFRFSVLEAAAGMGALLGSVLANRLSRRRRRGTLFGLGIAGMGIADASLAFVTNMYVATAAVFLAGLFNSLFIISGLTLVQSLTPSDVRGRVLAARFTVVNSALALGSAIGGGLLLFLSYRSLWLLEGGVIVAGSLFIWLNPDVRRQR